MTGQPRSRSALEALVNVALGYVVAITAQLVLFPLWGIRIGLGDNLAIGAAFTVVSLVRSYALRRMFDAWQTRRPA